MGEIQLQEPAAAARARVSAESVLSHARFARWQPLVFFACCAVMFSRRPDAVLNAQFFAEDGRNWFADAYNFGFWRVLIKPYEGYIHFIPRLAAGVSLLVPIAHAPLALNIIAIAIQALPVCLLLSPRSNAWGSLRFRVGLSLLYLLLSNTSEVMASITESQWPIALCALLIVTGSRAASRRGSIFDAILLILFGMTGPFSILLLPIAVFLLWKRGRSRLRIFSTSIVLACAVLQGLSLVLHMAGRDHMAVGASFAGLLQIVSCQVFLGTLLGHNTLFTMVPFGLLALLSLVGTVLVCIAFQRSSQEMGCLLAFAAMIFIVSMTFPTMYPLPGVTSWWILARDPGSRYWFFPCIAFAWSLAYCVRSANRAARIVAAVFLGIMSVGVLRDYRCPALRDLHFEDQAKRAEAAPAGSTIVIPENPEGWNLTIRKR